LGIRLKSGANLRPYTHKDMSRVGTGELEGSDAGAGSGEPESAPDEPAELAKDDLFHVLQNQRRRQVLNYLRTAEDRVEMGDVAEQIAAWENDKPVGAITSEERQRAYIALYQSHLPKLDGIGVVEYDQNRGTVERTPLADRFDPYLDVDLGGPPEDVETPPETPGDEATYYGAATLIGLALTGATWAGYAPTAPSGSLATVVTAMFATVTLALVVRNRQRKRSES
jgi:hypothetical protein